MKLPNVPEGSFFCVRLWQSLFWYNIYLTIGSRLMARLTQRRWGIIGSLGAILAGASVALAVISQHYHSINQEVLASKNALLIISDLEGNLKDAETGQRGFILTGDSSYLEPYTIGVGAAKANLHKLTVLGENDYLSQNTAEDIQNFTYLKFQELEQTIDLRRSKGIVAVLPLIKEGVGKTYMVHIRARTNRLRFLQETKLSANQAIAQQINRIRNSLIGLALLGGSTIIALLFCSFREELHLRKKIEESQVARLDALKASADLKERELSLRIHDWKSPLTVIISSMEILIKYKNRLSQDKIDKHYERIIQNSNALLNGFNDALVVARAEAGKLETTMHLSDVVVTCLNSINAVEIKLPEGRSIRFYTLVLGIPLLCDGVLLQRAIVNLLENAIKHTSSGEIAVSVSKRSEWVFIQVADQGEGIPSQDLSRLFKSFERGDTKVEGTGLGLAVVKSCADAHGGWVKVESDQTGEGFTLEHPESGQYKTVFTLAIPVAR